MNITSASQPPPLSLWRFCRHSLLREYGWQFFFRIALAHPLRTLRAVRAAAALDVSGGDVALPPADPAPPFGGPRSVVGLGFCLKPLDPPCPSGRFNHDCAFLAGRARAGAREIPAPCRTCVIREAGLLALRAGAAVYLMTSARDILFDLYVPARRRRLFTAGLFVLCRYSLRPFAVGLLSAGIRGRMWPFDTGDCRDYPTWLQADRGDKPERTTLAPASLRALREALRTAPPVPEPAVGFEKRGGILFPRAAASPTCPATP
jgi:hypothetical protein